MDWLSPICPSSLGFERRDYASALGDGNDTEGLAVGLLLSSVMPKQRMASKLQAAKAVEMAGTMFAMERMSPKSKWGIINRAFRWICYVIETTMLPSPGGGEV